MRRFVNVAGATLTAIGIAMLLTGELAAQGSGTRGAAPRTPWGHPDLQGLWNVGTMTPVERPANAKGRLTMTVEEARSLEQQQQQARAKLAQPSDGNRQAPPVGGDGTAGPYGNVGGYNYFWIDPGETLNKVDGQLRTSLVVDPPDGRVPQMRPEAMKRNSQSVQRARPTSDAGENVQTTQPGAYDDIEQRPLGERCIIGFGSTSGPPMLPTYFYNNLKQIVQTQGLRDDPDRDGPRRADHPVPVDACAAVGSQVDGRFDRPLGRRHARRRDHQLQRQDALPRVLGGHEGHRAVQPASRQHAPVSLHDRGSDDLAEAVDRASTRGRRRSRTISSTNTRATRATTPWKAS